MKSLLQVRRWLLVRRGVQAFSPGDRSKLGVKKGKEVSLSIYIFQQVLRSMPATEKGSVNYEKILFMKCTKRIDDMGVPCINPGIQDSIIHPQAFGLIYHVSPYGFLDPRSSFCIYLPICMNCLNVSTTHAATDPRSSFSFYTPQAYRNPVASRRIRPISCFYTIKPLFRLFKIL